MSNNYLPSNLRFLRILNGKSQSDIALQVKKKNTAISSWENGNSQPSLRDIEILSDFFGISTSDFVFKNLGDVHLNETVKGSKNIKNVHLKVNPHVHLNGENTPSEVHERAVEYESGKVVKAQKRVYNLEETMATALRALETANAVLERENAYLREENSRLKEDLLALRSKETTVEDQAPG